MNIYYYILLALSFFGLLVEAYKHGQPGRPYNMWTGLIAAAIVQTLLYFAVTN